MAENVVDFDSKVLEILESIKEPTKYNSIIDNKQKIFDLSDYCEKSIFYKKNKEKADLFQSSFDRHKLKERVVKCYLHVLKKIAYSPTKLHADGSVILVFPVLKNLIMLSEKSD